MKVKIAVFNTKPYDQEYFDRYTNKEELQFTYFDSPLNRDTVNLAAGYEVICVFVNDTLDRTTVEQLAEMGIKLIALRCAGYNNVDLDAAREKGIRVVRVPAYSPEAVAEHALALILTLNRKTHKAYNRVREGNFSLNKLMGFNLHGKTVGVIGTGKIGATFCGIMQGMGCRVIAFDLYPSEELKARGVEFKELEAVFRESDIISLHCPLNPETWHMINRDSLSKMKDGIMIINTSRGGLINTQDILKGLADKKIGFLGIDVYEQEENLFFKDMSEMIIEDDLILRLNSYPNVLITSHQAYFTREAMEEITLTTIGNITEYREGRALTNELT
ncbi:D-lactate dehydrogenase [Muriicola jejuensis]|uniref:2-hydroxyacid dehydrogenase n=1 Tax=Muriicola jejuensis TaxID=504488 RepID=A0A6P0UEL3_9FLAO|nr:2-hydroxyacid dehydrogenase [Muriicola jejuensis]NER11437.1 2-hydroxyacid dehydrogenase [Muriicola jejuensis]SMP20782.1 D-lactate dehydrogenase [Muriicola jejuensis]